VRAAAIRFGRGFEFGTGCTVFPDRVVRQNERPSPNRWAQFNWRPDRESARLGKDRWATLASFTVGGSLLPAIAAARLDPMTVLREE
jgi:hypothetical protein